MDVPLFTFYTILLYVVKEGGASYSNKKMKG